MPRAETLIVFEMLCLFALVFCAAFAVPAYPYFKVSPVARYVNPTFGLTVSIPIGMRACQSDTGMAISHGFWIPLDEESRCSDPFGKGRFISVLVSFEAAYDAQSPRLLAEAKCSRSIVEIPELQIPSHETIVCQQPYLERAAQGQLSSSGRIETTALTLVGGLSGTDFQVSLITTEDHVSQDVEALKRVLAGVEIGHR